MNDILSYLVKNKFVVIVAVLMAMLIYAYGNHFHNGFYFDDVHTITNNGSITEISNIPSFFTDITTFGTMPNNRTYRPVVTTLNAIDYWMGGGLDPFYFHLSIFLSYIILGIFIFLMTRRIFSFGNDSNVNNIAALLTTGFYMLHTANAETINYIIMRSDSFSTLWVVIGLLLYTNKSARRFQLHGIALLIGIATKESALMMLPILFVYHFLFESDLSIFDLKKKSAWNEVGRIILSLIPAAFMGIAFFWFSRTYFRPEAKLFASSSSNVFEYFYTQWFVITHYIGNFFFPVDLSADPDFKIIKNFWSHKVIFSGILLLSLSAIGLIATRKKEHRPIAFGIAWFFLSLLPTSSFKPFGQIANDHRTFFAYIGLVIALGCFLKLLYVKYRHKLESKPFFRPAFTLALLSIYSLHVYGIRTRNVVWSTSELLWKDVVEKSPENGRGLMNYGLTQMSKANYKEADKYFTRALTYLPYYSYLHINIGILKNAQGNVKDAEPYFLNALRFDPTNAEGYRFYARFLLEKGRVDEAKAMIAKGLEFSPNHTALLAMKANTQKMGLTPEEKLANQLEMATNEPSVNNYLNLSLQYFNMGRYDDCIETCKKVLELDPNNVLAYNNICISNVRLGNKDDAINACEKAIEINPNYNLAKNNLKLAKLLE